jgi:hypothetical protein
VHFSRAGSPVIVTVGSPPALGVTADLYPVPPKTCWLGWHKILPSMVTDAPFGASFAPSSKWTCTFAGIVRSDAGEVT